MIRFGSVCSGIEAASIAWHPLGWTPAWFAEIEPFPSAVLAHHYPDVPNLGDMTTIAARIAAGEVEAPDVLVGGTPCQSFSVAGLRGGLSDARGQLTLSFVELANAIDAARAVRGQQPSIIVWENVPGALSSKDNAFGCFLGALAGEDRELEPAGRRWSNAGCVFGPERTISWRILDAQYFGVAQRRRRAFVIASAREGFNPAEVLFEFDGVRRDSAPSREAGQGAAGTITSSLGRRAGVPDCASTPGLIQPVPAEGCWWDGGQVSQTLDAVLAKGQTMPEKNRFPAVLQPVVPLLEVGKRTGASTTDKRAGVGIGEDGDPMYTLQAGAQHGVVAFSCKDYGADAGPLSPTLRAMGHADSHANAGGQVAVAFNARQDPDSWAERTGPIDTDGSTQAVCVTGDVTHTLRAEGFDASEDGTGRGQPIVAMNVHENQRAELTLSDTAGAIKCAGGKPGQGYPAVMTVALRGREGGGTAELGGDTAGCLRASSGGGDKPHVLSAMAVRRLTPVECERLQGFPDNYTRIPMREYAARKVTRLRPAEMWGQVGDSWWLMSADGPRYKALGNSMAVPCMAFIGRRIDAAVRGAV